MTKVIALFDGQNLFHMVRHAFGNVSPNVNPFALADVICWRQGWGLEQVRYYTGIHSSQENPKLNAKMQAYLSRMDAGGIQTYARTLTYQNGVAREKGIDMRVALDAINVVYTKSADIILLFSQDQDFVELAEEVRLLNAMHESRIKIATAFPENQKFRGIDKTDWIRFSRQDYLNCLF